MVHARYLKQNNAKRVVHYESAGCRGTLQVPARNPCLEWGESALQRKPEMGKNAQRTADALREAHKAATPQDRQR
jgi:hypothetical protein